VSNLFQAWQAGRTVRKHTMLVRYRETVAEHTWGVVMLLLKYVPRPSLQLIKAAVVHDMGEQATCDIPAHLCWQHPALKEMVQIKEDEHVAAVMAYPQPAEDHAVSLTHDEELALEVADRAEFIVSCWYEHNMGNTFMRETIARTIPKVAESLGAMSESSQLRGAMQSLFTDLLRLTQTEAARQAVPA
jgi:5'-deoxynucleotidase YfbR-like HD superfamily hydrolase